jgi:hypothetical protein
LGLLFVASCGAGDEAPKESPKAGPPALAVPALKLSFNWQDLAVRGFDHRDYPGLVRLFAEGELSPSSKVLVISPCSGFFEYPLTAILGPTGGMLAACTKQSNWARLTEDFAGAPNLTVQQTFELKSLADEPSFDLAIVYDLNTEIPGEGPAAAFLASQLKPGGKLLFVHDRFVRYFSPELSWSPAHILGTFRREGPDFPLFKKLDPAVRADLQRQLDDGRTLLDQDSALRLFNEFNRLLPDPDLFLALNAFYNAKTGFSSEFLALLSDEQVQLARWLYWDLSHDLFGGQIDSGSEFLGVSVLNQMLISSVFAITIPAGRGQKERNLHFDTEYLRKALGSLGLAWVKTVEDFADVKVELFTMAP